MAILPAEVDDRDFLGHEVHDYGEPVEGIKMEVPMRYHAIDHHVVGVQAEPVFAPPTVGAPAVADAPP